MACSLAESESLVLSHLTIAERYGACMAGRYPHAVVQNLGGREDWVQIARITLWQASLSFPAYHERKPDVLFVAYALTAIKRTLYRLIYRLKRLGQETYYQDHNSDTIPGLEPTIEEKVIELEKQNEQRARLETPCTYCGATFTRKSRKHRFCTPKCGVLYRAEITKQKRAEARKGKICLCCGGAFDALKTIAQKYCSSRCLRKIAIKRSKEKHNTRATRRDSLCIVLQDAESELFTP